VFDYIELIGPDVGTAEKAGEMPTPICAIASRDLIVSFQAQVSSVRPQHRLAAACAYRKRIGTVAKNCFMRRRNDNERRTA
jgi:hypothetical protein